MRAAIILDACGDLGPLFEDVVSSKTLTISIFERAATHGFPYFQLEGERTELRDFIRMNWGDDCISDADECGWWIQDVLPGDIHEAALAVYRMYMKVNSDREESGDENELYTVLMPELGRALGVQT